jgi:hypothetical protein
LETREVRFMNPLTLLEMGELSFGSGGRVTLQSSPHHLPAHAESR